MEPPPLPLVRNRCYLAPVFLLPSWATGIYQKLSQLQLNFLLLHVSFGHFLFQMIVALFRYCFIRLQQS